MNPQKSGAALPIMLVVLTGMYGYWAVQGVLVSSRPSALGQYDVPDPVPTPGVHTLHSRMWEDPLTNAYEHWKRLPENQQPRFLRLIHDSEELNLAVMRTASFARASEAPSVTKATVDHQADDARKDMQRFFRSLATKNETICLPVFVPGGPYAEDKERRMRIRYSVVTGLAEAGYHLKYSLRMSYVVPKIYVRTLRAWQQREVVVPIKLYRHDTKPEVLVLWINESELGLRPLLATHRLLNAMFGTAEDDQRKSFKLSIIGPASSGTLTTIAPESRHIEDAFILQVIRDSYAEDGQADNLRYVQHALSAINSIANYARKFGDGEAAGEQRTRAKQLESLADDIGNATSYFRVRQLAEIIRQLVKGSTDWREKAFWLASADLIEHSTRLGTANADHAGEIAEAVGQLRRITAELNKGDRQIVQLPELSTTDDAKQRIISTYQTIKAAERIKQEAAKPVNDPQLDSDKIDGLVERIVTHGRQLIQRTAGDIELGSASYQWSVSLDDDDPLITGFQPCLMLPDSDGTLIDIFSPRATEDDITWHENHVVNLHRVIGTDYQLAQTLRKELECRNATRGQIVLVTEHDTSYGRAFPETFQKAFPADFDSQIKPIFQQYGCLECHTNQGAVRPNNWLVEGNKPTDRLVKAGDADNSPLIKKLKEQDEVHWMEDADLRLLRRWIKEGAGYETHLTRFTSFKILRGIDGNLPGDNPRSPSPGQKEGNPYSSSVDLPEIVERPPEGRTQYDYLKRLRHRIEQLGDVKAIGVVGSDVYDKLLVLRALKPHFPSCVFFTTDLHAIYTHSEQLPHTRNLLIASHFDLSLNGELQTLTPPFRDSYQTSTFLAAQLAVHQAQNAKIRKRENSIANWNAVFTHWFPADRNSDEPSNPQSVTVASQQADHGNRSDGRDIKPVLHVVGKDRTYRLNHETEGSLEAILHPREPAGSGNWHYFFVALVAFVFCGTAYAVAQRDRISVSPLVNSTGETRLVQRLLVLFQHLILRIRVSLRRMLDPPAWIKGFDGSLQQIERYSKQRGKSLENRINLSLTLLIGIGILLLFFYCLRGAYGPEAASFFAGYSTWPRKAVYAITGVAAIVFAASAVDQFLFEVKEVDQAGGRPANLATAFLQDAQLLKIGIFALALVFSGGLFMYGLVSFGFGIPAGLIVGIFALASRYRRKRSPRQASSNLELSGRSSPSHEALYREAVDNVVLYPGPQKTIRCGLAAVIAVGLLAVFAEIFFQGAGFRFGWNPASASRGLLSQFGDWVANAYAFGTIALLVATLLYLDAWCWEFSRFYLQHGVAGPTNQGRDLDLLDGLSEEQKHQYWEAGSHADRSTIDWSDRVDLLSLLARVTSVPATVRLSIMGLLFVLVIAYHPWLSPKPMPLSLLVLTTLTVLIFMLSNFALRRHLRNLREEMSTELRSQLSCLREEVALRPAADVPSLPAPSARDDQLSGIRSEPGAIETLTIEKQPRTKSETTGQLVSLTLIRKRLDGLSDGVFRPWAQSPLGWVLNAGTTLALVDIWIRWWTVS